MMIKDFELDDLIGFIPNELSDPRDISFVFSDDEYYKYTLVNGGAKAIIVFRYNGNDDWCGFFLISEDFTPRDGILVKQFIKKTVAKYKPKRLWTVSYESPVIERWHKFLGMKREDPIVIHGKKCDVWSIKWE